MSTQRFNQQFPKTNYKIHNNCINYSMQLNSNDRKFKNNSMSSFDLSKSKKSYKYFDKLKHAYCSAMIENPSDEKYKTKTILMFFKNENIKYPSIDDDDNDKMYEYIKERKEIVCKKKTLNLNSSMIIYDINQQNQNNNNSINLHRHSQSQNTINNIQREHNELIIDQFLNVIQQELEFSDTSFNMSVESNSNQSSQTNIRPPLQPKFDNNNQLIQNNNNELNKKKFIINSSQQRHIDQYINDMQQELEFSDSFNMSVSSNSNSTIPSQNNMNPPMQPKHVEATDINWEVIEITGERKNPENKRKKQFQAIFRPDKHFVFDTEEQTEWINESMMNCTKLINEYRVENDMPKIKSKRKRAYIGSDPDITSSQIDFDFQNKKYKTNQTYEEKRKNKKS
jgi:hypothetical protein